MGAVVRLEIAAAGKVGKVIGACGGVPFLPGNKAPLARRLLRRDRARVFYQPSFLDC
jgi:hypothetical protein